MYKVSIFFAGCILIFLPGCETNSSAENTSEAAIEELPWCTQIQRLYDNPLTTPFEKAVILKRAEEDGCI